MKIEYRSISSIRPYENNAKKHPQKQIQQIADSIENFGFHQPIVVDADGVIIVGHGRYAAAQLLGMLEVPVEVAYDLTEEQVAAYRYADNKLNESDWDMSMALPELRGMSLPMFELTGFDPNILEDKYDDYTVGSIRDRFLVPPFSILNTREGQWQSRKKEWLRMGIQSELGRSDDLMGKGLTTLSAKQNTEYKTGIGLTGTSIFDPVLCELMYLWFAPERAMILDPFAGGSVRGIVAAKLGHQYHGTELRQEQVDANIEQGKKLVPNNQPTWVCDDAKNIGTHFKAESYDLMMTCPPYADLEVYSKDPRDISNMEYNDFLEAYRTIIAESVKLLKENTFAVCVVGEVRGGNGKYYNFVGDTIRAYEDAGMHYYNEIILVNMIGTLGMRITKQFNSGRKIGKTHQNVLVFWKGDPAAVKETVKTWAIQGDIFATPIGDN